MGDLDLRAAAANSAPRSSTRLDVATPSLAATRLHTLRRFRSMPTMNSQPPNTQDGPFRFYAYVDGRRSSEWSVIVSGKTDDEVYASTRNDIGDLKVSLHSSRYSQHGLTARVREKLSPRDGDRQALDKWKRRIGPPGQRTIAYRIVLPGAAMMLPTGNTHPKALPLPLANPGNELVVDLNFTEPPLTPAGDYWPDGPLVAQWHLGRGTLFEVTMQERKGTFMPTTRDYANAWGSRPVPAPILTEGPGYIFGWDATTGTRFARELR